MQNLHNFDNIIFSRQWEEIQKKPKTRQVNTVLIYR